MKKKLNITLVVIVVFVCTVFFVYSILPDIATIFYAFILGVTSYILASKYGYKFGKFLPGMLSIIGVFYFIEHNKDMGSTLSMIETGYFMSFLLLFMLAGLRIKPGKYEEMNK